MARTRICGGMPPEWFHFARSSAVDAFASLKSKPPDDPAEDPRDRPERRFVDQRAERAALVLEVEPRPHVVGVPFLQIRLQRGGDLRALGGRDLHGHGLRLAVHGGGDLVLTLRKIDDFRGDLPVGQQAGKGKNKLARFHTAQQSAGRRLGKAGGVVPVETKMLADFQLT